MAGLPGCWRFADANIRPRGRGGEGERGAPACGEQRPGMPALLHLRNLREVGDERLDSARRLPPVVVFVRRVIAVLWKAQADAHDRRLEVALHRDDGAYRAAFADERRGRAEA